MDFHHDKVGSGMNFEEFVRVLFPKQDKYRLACAWFLKLLSEKEGVDGYDLSVMCREKNCSRATLQKVFVKLRNLGLVSRRSGRYYLSNEFSSATRRLGEAWKSINKNKKFDFNELFLRDNL